MNTGKKPVTAPAIKIGDVGFVPYLNNLISINSDILSGTSKGATAA
jgi:hypothetical protein